MDVIEFLKQGTLGQQTSLFLAGLWWAWRAKNAEFLGQENFPLHKLLSSVYALCFTLKGCFPDHMDGDWLDKWIKWHPSGELTTILNADGSSLGNPGRAGCGGVIRNLDGSRLRGFSGFIGISDNLLSF